MHLGQKCQKIVAQRCRERRVQKPAQSFFIVGAVDGEIQQIILGEKAVENIRRQHHAWRDRNVYISKAPRSLIFVQQMTDESQPARFPAQRAAANAQKKSLARFESGRVEISDQNLALLAAIFSNGLDQIASQSFERSKIRNFPWSEFLSQDEFGSRPQPAREMV